MTDNEIIKAQIFDEDFFKINVGDEVIFKVPQYRNFVIGKVVTKAPKSCQIEYVDDWNCPTEGRKRKVRRYYGQIIKNPIDLINRQKTEIERLKGSVITNNVVKISKIRKTVKSEAIKEFAERLKEKADRGYWQEHFYVDIEDIDNLVKEMTEAEK